ncbi:Hypothetical protein ERGA_CDS_07470 [Ehrlichia ruminantium str. Gardel]|uniref:hypothetical protein n=1 Tax=Ehrlichia ruminantium TaxID=779 RepID=UPI00004C78F1|nr:hypothetical protein [Ehrlichia ruminantium]CAI28199.1 Hypothetical protein ERGA_CDS_07470 [Ehrlichia ruminantium str. Gardel]
MKLSLYIVSTIGVIILLFCLMLILYCIDIAYANIKNCVFNNTGKTKNAVNLSIENRVKNSVLCGLKKEFRSTLRSFCDYNNVNSVAAKSAQYGGLMVKAGSKYIQDLISEIDDRIVNQYITGRVLSLEVLIMQFEDTIYTICNEETIQCELQRVLYVRLLLNNILKLTKSICEQSDIELMEIYGMKFEYALSFIHSGFTYIMKNICALSGNVYCNNQKQLCTDDVTFTTISLYDINHCISR